MDPRDAAGRRRGSFMSAAGPVISWALRRWADAFFAQARDYRATSNRTLDRLLATNGRTAFGRRCGLDGRDPRAAFERLPLTTYADYVPWIERQAAGEQRVLSAQRVAYFATTSGTTGPQKLVPITHQQMRSNIRALMMPFGIGLRQGILQPIRGRLMMTLTEHAGGETAGAVPKGGAITGSLRYLGDLTDAFVTAPLEVMRVHDQEASRYLQLLFALGEERLWTILAFFPTTLLLTLRDLHARREGLLRDLADGTLDPGLALPADTRARLLRRLQPRPARARALAALAERGAFTVPEIWPGMGAILTASGGTFRFYVDQLRPLLGGLPVYSPVYGASEALVGFGISAESSEYVLLPGISWIELVPVEEANDPRARPVPAWEATPGRDYEVVVTTPAGFTRYRLHDVVRMRGFHGEAPVVEFVERSGQVVDILGEKTAEHHVVEAVSSARREVEAQLVDYVLTPDTGHAPPRYVLAVEAWPGDAGGTQRVQALVQATEAALRRTAGDYDEERGLGTLGPLTAVLLRRGAFERYRQRRIAAGASASQVKTPHVVPDPGFLQREFAGEFACGFESPPP